MSAKTLAEIGRHSHFWELCFGFLQHRYFGPFFYCTCGATMITKLPEDVTNV